MNDIKKHKHIVFCGDNYNALGLIRSLGEKELNPIVVNYSPHPYLINHSKFAQIFHQMESAVAALDFIVEKWGNESEKPFIYTMDEYTTMLLDKRYDELIDKFYFFNCGKAGALAYYQDKKNLCDLAEQCGIQQPKGEVLKKGELPKTLRYPVLTKVTLSIKGAWKDDVFVCQNEEELIEAYKHIKADELLVQEYIEKKNELCIDGISINGGEHTFFSYTSEYLRMSNQSFGNYMRFIPYENQEVRDKLTNILKRAHYTGLFDAECLIGKEGELYFLEINFRNSAWGYAYTYGGINLPYYWAKCTLEGPSGMNDCHYRKEPFTAMAELADLSTVAHMPDVSYRTWLRQFHQCDCTYIYNATDKRPFYHAIWYKIKTAIKHKIMSFFGKYTYKV